MAHSTHIIAVDGLAASGKSSAARLLAQRYGFAWISTGKLYRLAGLCAQRQGLDLTQTSQTSRSSVAQWKKLARQLEKSVRARWSAHSLV